MLPHLSGLMSAFYDLTGSRTYTMGGEGPIPISEIAAYCDLDGITDPDERIAFMRSIRAMDMAYLEYRRQEREKDKDDKASEGAPRR